MGSFWVIQLPPTVQKEKSKKSPVMVSILISKNVCADVKIVSIEIYCNTSIFFCHWEIICIFKNIYIMFIINNNNNHNLLYLII